VYSADLRKHYDLKDPAWRYDIMPEIIDGHNVADFIDPDIDAKLAELEREEEQLEAAHQAEVRDIEVLLPMEMWPCLLLVAVGAVAVGAGCTGGCVQCCVLSQTEHNLPAPWCVAIQLAGTCWTTKLVHVLQLLFISSFSCFLLLILPACLPPPQMAGVMDTDELTEEQAADLAAIRARKKQIVAAHRIKKASASNRPVMAAKVGAGGKLQASALRQQLGSMGIDTSAAEARLRERSQSRGRKRSRCAVKLTEWGCCLEG
jgi:hypothetical protein